MVAAGAAGLSALPIVLSWRRLPEPIAIHWSASGAPDGSMSKIGFILFCCGVLAVFAAVGSLGRSAGKVKGSHAGPFFLMATGGMLIPAIASLCTVLNFDRPDWRQAEHLTWSDFGLVFIPSGLALVVGVAVSAALGRGTPGGVARPTSTGKSNDATESSFTMTAGGAEPQVWTGRASNHWVLPWIALLVAGTIYLAVRGGIVLALAQLAAILLLELLSSIRVSVDAAGVAIQYGHLGWVRQRIKLSCIESASVTELDVWSPYGWGYRGSLTLFKRATIVIRSGTALRLDLTDGGRLLVSVDDAESASRLVNRLHQGPKFAPGAEPSFST